MMRIFVRDVCIAATLSVAAVVAAHAQGTLSTQGFGYPGGQFSTRALGAGGALAEFDANTPLNPAALVVGVRGSVYFQYDPEFRSTATANGIARTVTARFPVMGVTGQFGRATLALSFSSLLDRSWTNTYTDSQTVAGRVVASRITAQTTGGISDARVAMSYRVNDNLHFGLGLHVFPGQNRTLLGRDFADSLKIGSFTQASIFNFSGTAISFGVLSTPVPHLNVGLSTRVGGAMKLRMGDSTVIGRASVPNRWSLAAAYDGFSGSALAVRYARENWSSMRGLGSPGLAIRDAAEFAAGVELAGPRLSGIPSAMRLGFRSRDLPFDVGAQKVAERALSAGVGIPFAAGRGAFDLSLVRARRTSGALSETGWIVSAGIAIKP